MEKREDRRDRTLRAAERSWKIWTTKIHGSDPDQWDSKVPVGSFRKRSAMACNCRSRHKNRPKISSGICYDCGSLRPAVRIRIANKRLCAQWAGAAAGIDPGREGDRACRVRQ